MDFIHGWLAFFKSGKLREAYCNFFADARRKSDGPDFTIFEVIVAVVLPLTVRNGWGRVSTAEAIGKLLFPAAVDVPSQLVSYCCGQIVV